MKKLQRTQSNQKEEMMTFKQAKQTFLTWNLEQHKIRIHAVQALLDEWQSARETSSGPVYDELIAKEVQAHTETLELYSKDLSRVQKIYKREPHRIYRACILEFIDYCSVHGFRREALKELGLDNEAL